MPEQSTAHDVLTVPPERTSSGAARRFVASVLEDLELPHLVDGAVLAVSELVTNAVLHARTEIDVVVSATPTEVRVAVGDLSADLPVVREYGSWATTGRGLGMVAALVDELGVRARGDGKEVWFALSRARTEEVAADPEDSAAGDLSAWGLDGWEGWDVEAPADADEGQQQAPAAAPALLLEVPVALWLAAHQHHDAALRELVLYRGQRAPESDDAWAWYDAADRGHTALGTAVDRAVAAALAAGEAVPPLPAGHPSPLPDLPATVSVEVALEPALPAALAALAEALDDADRLAATEDLLLHPALPEVVALRDWCCHQVIAQAGGAAPSPWTPWTEDSPADGSGEPLPTWDDAVVRHAPGAVLAVDDRNRVIALSPSAERLVGWSAHDLVGRRVVTLIPPRLREAHVAGFTRHQTTGQAHVLGVEVVLPVLHAAGHEVECRFLIERVHAVGGRSVYLASLDPLRPLEGPVAPAG